MSTEAKIIADSISPEGVRLTTMQVTLHRFVLAEFNTHRVFSRNSASSRAIPVSKQITRILDDLALPVSWPAEQSGMQGGEHLAEMVSFEAETVWMGASQDAIKSVRRLLTLGPDADEALHKSVVNRLLEPFMWHTVVVTSTAWENFFALRLDADAQPEIRVAAEAMKAAYDTSTPEPLTEGMWHAPYVDKGDGLVALGRVGGNEREAWALLTKISAARCARTSYLTQEGKRDLDEDLRLYDRLITDRLAAGKALHWSPLEHVATPWPENRQEGYLYFQDRTAPLPNSDIVAVPTNHLPRVGNLLGWRSLRTEVEASVGALTFR